ncbi:MAG: endopeptidase La [Oceanospirillum sp.]|nr:endopeptidase La [Oceanospirillum sp.]
MSDNEIPNEQDNSQPEPDNVKQGTTDSSGTLILPSDALPERIYLLPVHNRPYFPAQVQPLIISRQRWQKTMERLADTPHHIVGLCYVGDIKPEEIDHRDFNTIGCAARVHKVSLEEGGIQFVAQGLRRFRIVRWLNKEAPYLVEVEYPKEEIEDSDEVKAYAMALISAIKELLPLNPLYGEELKNYLNHFDTNEPSPLADFAAAITTADGDDLQDILKTLPVLERMKKVMPLLQKELEVARLQSEIREEVNQKVSENQRKFFLKEEMKVIQRELGISKDDKTAELDEFKERISKLTLPEQVEKRISEEMDKFSMLETGSAEYGVTRNYLEWITSLPWGITTEDNLDLKHAREVLNQDHDGLEDVKDRILEFLAEGSFKGEVSGSILLLVGPPGVGKTSIGRSIADALGRPFYRFSVGGMRDEAEIKGHRRTYIGAMPGKLVQALKDVELSNPVIMLDEIDKIGASYQGDPASALLEVLDPEQNSEFLDHYLDVRLDLSKVLFVCTANQLDSIPGPLLDRMETIRLSGYIAEEKLQIAKNHIWPKLLKRAKLLKKQVDLSDAALKQVIEGYAREAGVRQLEKQLHRIMRKAAVQLLESDQDSIKVNAKNLEEYLGAPIFRKEQVLKGVGVVTGLAWTSMGGATLPIEASVVHNKGRSLKLTGKLGDVMKESAELAISYASSQLAKHGVDEQFFDNSAIHLHVPEGATPKDGPSAGVTMTTALLSLARNEALPRSLAMTGEITLTGHVLPVGGIREKVIAARRSKIMEVILPAANQRDYDELPDSLKEGMTVHFASHYQDIAKLIFGA